MTRGFYAIGIVHGKRRENIGTLFRSAVSFGAAFVFTVGRRYAPQASDTPKSWLHIPVHHFATVDDLVAHLPYGTRLIGVEMADTAISLWDYAHPARAVYLLGAEDHGLTTEQQVRCHQLVRINGAAHCLNVAVAGSIILHDRVIKADAGMVRRYG